MLWVWQTILNRRKNCAFQNGSTFTWAGLEFDYSTTCWSSQLQHSLKMPKSYPECAKTQRYQVLNKEQKFPLSITSVETVCQRSPVFELLWLQLTTTASVRASPVLVDTDNSQKNNFIITQAFYVFNYSGEMHSWCNRHEWSYTRDHFSSANVVQIISHWHTFQLKIMQNEVFCCFRFTCSVKKLGVPLEFTESQQHQIWFQI